MKALTSHVSKHILCLILDPSSYQESLLPSGRIREQFPRDALNISPIGNESLCASADRTGQSFFWALIQVIGAEETSLSAHVASSQGQLNCWESNRARGREEGMALGIRTRIQGWT